MLVELKVKVASLAAEGAIIRRLERRRLAAFRKQKQKQKDDYANTHYGEFYSLHYHRTHKLRKTARHAQLAYGFLRGIEYWRMENDIHEDNAPDFKLVEKEVEKFATGDMREVKQRFEQWLTEAIKHARGCQEWRKSQRLADKGDD